jgi:hypothetical protein
MSVIDDIKDVLFVYTGCLGHEATRLKLGQKQMRELREFGNEAGLRVDHDVNTACSFYGLPIIEVEDYDYISASNG